MIVCELDRLARMVSKYCVGMEGNISGKCVFPEATYIYIKASGSRMDSIGIEDIVRVDSATDEQVGENLNKKPSMEYDFHKWLLTQQYTDIKYVCHTHPINTLKILCNGDTFATERFVNNRLFPDQVIFNGAKSCLVPYETPGKKLSSAVERNVLRFIELNGYFPKLILLQNHGIIACGKTIEECAMITDICEKAAEIFVGCLSMNSRVRCLSQKSVDELLEDDKEKYRQSCL